MILVLSVLAVAEYSCTQPSHLGLSTGYRESPCLAVEISSHLQEQHRDFPSYHMHGEGQPKMANRDMSRMPSQAHGWYKRLVARRVMRVSNTMGNFKLLNLFKPAQRIIPDVPAPQERRVPFKYVVKEPRGMTSIIRSRTPWHLLRWWFHFDVI